MTCLGCIGMLIAAIILFHINPLLGFVWIGVIIWFAERYKEIEEEQEQDKDLLLKRKEEELKRTQEQLNRMREELRKRGIDLGEDEPPTCYSPPAPPPNPPLPPLPRNSKPGPPPKIQDP